MRLVSKGSHRPREEGGPRRAGPEAESLSLGAYGYIMAKVRSNPLRAGATITAVAVAVTFLIIVSSISVGLEGATERELLDYTVGTPELPISDFIQTEEGDFVGMFAPRLLDPEDVDAIRLRAQTSVGSAQDVKVYAYSERVLGRIPYSGLAQSVRRLIALDPTVGLTTPYTHYSTSMSMASGEHLSSGGGREVVLGYELWQQRFPTARVGSVIDLRPEGASWYGADVVDLRSGRTITLRHLDGITGVRLAGILVKDLATDQNAYVALSLFAEETGAGTTARGPRSEAVSVEVRRGGLDLEAMADDLTGQTTRISSFFVTRQGVAASTELAEDLRSSIYAWLVLAVAVIIAGMVLGVANTAYLSVSQRVREIGTLRALGLGRDQVRRLVQWEALFLGMMGGALGFFAGHILMSSVITELFELEGLGILLAPGRTVPVVVLLSILAVLGATLVGAYLPARRASELEPHDALTAPE